MPEDKSVVVKKRKPVRGVLKKLVNVKAWFSYDEVSANTKNTWGLFRRLISRTPKELVRKETYEEAIIRLGLTPEQVITRKKNFLYSAMVYGVFALGFFIYFIYLLVHIRILASLLTIILIVLMSLAAYREHFWYMQMQKKKLGCNFREWLAFVLGRSA